MEDRDLDWIARFDWRQHGKIASNTVSDKMPYAKAASLLAEYAAGPDWPHEIGFFLSKAGNRPVGDHVDADAAFAADGKPTSLYHDHLPLALEHARHLKVPLASRDAITRTEWEEIDQIGAQDWAEGEGARRMVSLLGPLLARLAHKNEAVRTFARPIGGGEDVRLARELWLIDPDVAIARLASCGINLDKAFSAEAHPTHRLFVQPDPGLDAAFREAARDNYIPHAFVEVVFPRPIDETAPSKAILKAYLRSLMNEHPDWSRQKFTEAVEDRYGIKFPERMHRDFRRAILSATDDTGLRDKLARTGPKRG